MSDFTVGEYRGSDIEELTALWQKCFGDSEGLIKAFFSLLPKMGSGLVARAEDKIIGMAYTLRAMDYVDGGKIVPCAYIYAVAVDESFRGRGVGAALTKAAAHAGRQWQAKIISTLPAEPSLYGWYEKLIGLSPVLYRSRRETECVPGLDCREAGAAEYIEQREMLLCGKPHLSVSLHMAEFQRRLCREYGGGLYLGEGFAGFGYMEDGIARIKELVCAENVSKRAAAGAIGRMMGASRALLYEADREGKAYISAGGGDISENCVWNFSFD